MHDVRPLISVTSHKFNQVVSASPVPELSGNREYLGNSARGSAERRGHAGVCASDRKYARADTGVFIGRPSAAETAADQEGKDWKGGGSAAKKKRAKSPLRYEKHAAVT